MGSLEFVGAVASGWRCRRSGPRQRFLLAIGTSAPTHPVVWSCHDGNSVPAPSAQRTGNLETIPARADGPRGLKGAPGER